MKSIRADQEADAVLREFNVKTPPVPVEEIARQLGARVSYEPFSREVSGVLFRDEGKGNAVIAVNASHTSTRHRFTIAHELGHLRLHEGTRVFVDRPARIDRRDGVASKGVDRHEIEANRFAAALLMPHEMLVAELNGAPDLQIRELIDILARRFDVSKQAMGNRLSNLGLSLES